MAAMATVPGARIVRGDVAAQRPGGARPQRVLSLAPRAVPRTLVWRLWFGTPIALFAWLFAAIGMGATCAFLPMMEITAPDYDRTSTATIEGAERSGSRENERDIYRVHYSFRDDAGVTRRGAAYSFDYVTSGQRLVHYIEADPAVSCLDGMRSRPFGWLPLFVLLFPIVGVGLALPQLRAGMLASHLLRHGLPTRGRLVGIEPTGTRLNRQPVMALTFEYEVDGIRYATVVKTLTPGPLEDDEEEAMLYDPQHPRSATTLDNLPGAPRIGADGALLAAPGIGFHVLIMPTVTAILFAVTFIRHLGS